VNSATGNGRQWPRAPGGIILSAAVVGPPRELKRELYAGSAQVAGQSAACGQGPRGNNSERCSSRAPERLKHELYAGSAQVAGEAAAILPPHDVELLLDVLVQDPVLLPDIVPHHRLAENTFM
jgi:hypothetical protein